MGEMAGGMDGGFGDQGERASVPTLPVLSGADWTETTFNRRASDFAASIRSVGDLV